MLFIRFSILLCLAMGPAWSQSRFSSKSCLDSTYKMKMTQNGPLFGLLKHEFIIDKNNCVMHITHKKYLPKEWIIDVCREPVHIKVTSATGVDVAKKEGDCSNQDKTKDTSDFCSQLLDLTNVIQDDGLIFAEGDRDNLSSDHGKTFCSYLLVKKYLDESMIFSRYTDVPDIFLEKNQATPKPMPSLPKDEGELKKEDQKASLSIPDLAAPPKAAPLAPAEATVL